MDAVLTNNKQTRIMKTMKKSVRGNLISNPSENFDTYAGVLNPPSRAMSFSYSYQPPLLPLPQVFPIQQHLLSRSLSSQGMSFPKNRTPKKSKPKKSILIVASDNNGNSRWGPDPKYLPKHLPVVLNSKVEQEKSNMVEDMLSGSIFNLAPPPSSLPLPKFSLRSKLSCNAEAAGGGGGVDSGATNNLRRLLRLR